MTSKTIAIIAGALFVLSLGGMFYFMKKNKDLKTELTKKKTRIETLQKEQVELEDKITTLSGTNEKMDNVLDKVFKNLSAKAWASSLP